MPTPSEAPVCPPALSGSHLARAGHTTCPPEEDRSGADQVTSAAPRDGPQQATVNFLDPRHAMINALQQVSQDEEQPESMREGTPSPVPATLLDAADKTVCSRLPTPPLKTASVLPSPLYSSLSSSGRSFPRHTSSFLRSGSVFKGSQQSDRMKYNVTVEVKHVDMSESIMCGYLTIQDLTQDHPNLTTYFEGEIIGNKYSFQTRRPDWGSNDKVDMQHWNRFPAWKPLAREARKPEFNYKDFADREDIFMRWKEYFLVPDHRVRTISGASFEGFYYICFNQKKGTISGIYFHSKSEKYQQLELTHVDDRGCSGAVEFR